MKAKQVNLGFHQIKEPIPPISAEIIHVTTTDDDETETTLRIAKRDLRQRALGSPFDRFGFAVVEAACAPTELSNALFLLIFGFSILFGDPIADNFWFAPAWLRAAWLRGLFPVALGLVQLLVFLQFSFRARAFVALVSVFTWLLLLFNTYGLTGIYLRPRLVVAVFALLALRNFKILRAEDN